jgi:alkylation response protein AidB-like acyl-CoA dehydrogenase
MTCNEEAGIASAYLEAEPMTSHFTNHPSTVIAGSGVPKGTAERVDGGWELTGRWDFVSGCTASDHLVLASVVAGATPAKLCFVLVPTQDVTIEDTWTTHGLRGTGSNDVVLDGRFVDDRWAGVVPTFAPPRPDTPFYGLPSGLRFPFPKVGVAAGLARAAIDEFVSLAAGKRPLFASGNLAERPGAQAAIARAEASVSAGLAWVHEMLDDLWAVATAGSAVPMDLHARCRLACSNSVDASITAVEQLCREAGTTANFPESPLPQLLLDVRAVAGHFMVAPYQMNTAGRILLGLDPVDRHF